MQGYNQQLKLLSVLVYIVVAKVVSLKLVELLKLEFLKGEGGKEQGNKLVYYKWRFGCISSVPTYFRTYTANLHQITGFPKSLALVGKCGR